MNSPESILTTLCILVDWFLDGTLQKLAMAGNSLKFDGMGILTFFAHKTSPTKLDEYVAPEEDR